MAYQKTNKILMSMPWNSFC